MDFNYDNAKDSELYFTDNLTICNTKIKIQAATVSSSVEKQNEDSFCLKTQDDTIWAAVFDGITNVKKIDNISETGARFCSHYLKTLFYETRLTSPKETLLDLNKLLLDKSISLGGNLNDTHTMPSAMATILKLDFKSNVGEFAHVGDTYLIKYLNDGSSKILTNDVLPALRR